jgi:hypothetical protein
MNSPLELRKVHLRGLLPRAPGAATGIPTDRWAGGTGCGRTGAWDATHGQAAESPPGANEFAAGTTQSPPSWTVAAGAGRCDRHPNGPMAWRAPAADARVRGMPHTVRLPSPHQERMNSPLELRKVHLRGLLPRVPGRCDRCPNGPMGWRAPAADAPVRGNAAHRRAAESAPGANEFAAGTTQSPPARTAAAGAGRCDRHPRKPIAGGTGCGRAGAWDAAHRRAAESTKVDFVQL